MLTGGRIEGSDTLSPSASQIDIICPFLSRPSKLRVFTSRNKVLQIEVGSHKHPRVPVMTSKTEHGIQSIDLENRVCIFRPSVHTTFSFFEYTVKILGGSS